MGRKGRRQKMFLPDKEEQAEDEVLAERASALKARIKNARKKAKDLEDRDFKRTGVKRSKVQLLSRFRQELDPFAAMLVIMQVESNLKREIDRHPKDRRLLEDLVFARRQKTLLLESHPRLKEQIEEEDCPFSRF